MNKLRLVTITTIALSATVLAQTGTLPRTADGKPDFQGIWQASTSAGADFQEHAAALNMLAGRSVVAGGAPIPYQPWAAKQRAENFKNRQTADPLNKCFLPGVPRVMYLDFPFQIFQGPKSVTMAFEWELEYRLIYTDGTPHREKDDDSWMGDSRGHWEGDTLVVDVANNNDKTWFNMAGDFHSDQLHVTERYRMTDRDTIQYEATIEDQKVLTKPYTISLPLRRRVDRDRLFEYVCQAEKEELSGDFTREDKTWYPGAEAAPVPAMATTAAARVAPVPPAAGSVANIRRMPDGKPDFQGFYESQSRGANQGLERRGGRGPGPNSWVIDPPDGKLPMLAWAMEERTSRDLTERGYDDPTAHCFPAGVPRSMYVPEGLEIVQTKDYLVFLHERVAWRIIPLDGRAHLKDTVRLWQGDSVGHWEGDSLVIDTTNLNGKTWLDEFGEIVSHAEHAVERLTPVNDTTFNYEATVTDPIVYTRPWTIAFPVKREKFELREAACHEEDHDLPHLKALKEAAAAKRK
ncbi:MAG TPA: hypothetical protein VGN17_05980 [Bryobacteraceae bacterium]|jgi:hypothetical protein